MPSITRTPLPGAPRAPANAPAAVPQDDEQGQAPAQVAATPTPTGSTGGMIPRQGGEWWHAQSAPIQWSADPQQRTQQAMAETDRRLEAHFGEQNPFRTSFDKVATPASFYQHGVAQANQEFQQQAVQARQQQTQANNQFNSAALAKYKASGQQYYTDPATGRLTPVVDEQGRSLYHPTAWEDATHPKTGLPVLQKRDQFGQRQFKDLPVVPGLDATDDQMYFKKADGTLAPAGKIADMVASPDYNVAKVALAANRRRVQAVHQQALAPMKELVDATNEQFKNAQDQRDDLNRQIQQATQLRDQNVGDAAAYAGYDATVNQLTQQLGGVNAQLAPKGELAMGAAAARRHYDIARRQAMLDTYKAQNDEIAARLQAEGKDPATDPAFRSNLQGMQTVQKSLAAAQPGAQAAPSPVAAPAAPSPLELSEPANLMKQGQKSIGGVSLATMAQRFGSGEGPVQPSSLLAIRQRLKEIDDTLNANTQPQGAVGAAVNPSATTQISGKLRKSLEDQQQYLTSLSAQRYARLSPDQQAQVDATLKKLEPTTATGAFARSVGTGVLPAAGALAGATLGGRLLAPTAGATKGLGPLVGTVLGAFAGGILADKAQKAALNRVAPDTSAELERLQALDAEGQPVAAAAGQLVSNLPVFKANPLMAARGLAALSKIARGAAVNAEEKAAAKILALQGGFAGAVATGQPLAEGRKPTLGEVTQGAAQMMLFGEGRFGGHGPAPESAGGGKAAAEAAFQAELAKDNPPGAAPTEARPPPGRSAEDVAGIFERNLPQVPSEQAPAKSAQESAAAFQAHPEGGISPPEGAARGGTPDELAAVTEAGKQARVERIAQQMAGGPSAELSQVPPEVQARLDASDLTPQEKAEFAQLHAQSQSVDIGARDESVSTGTGTPTAKEQAMLAERQRLVDEHLNQTATPADAAATATPADQPAAPAAPTEETQHALQEPSPSGLLQHPPKGTPEAGGEHGRVEQGVQREAPPEARQAAAPVEGGVAKTRGEREPQQGTERTPEGSPAVQENVGRPATAELRANNAGADLPPISGMSRAAKRAELDGAGIKEYNGKPLDEANPAEISNAVGKLRRGELGPEGEKPGAAEPRRSDKIIKALEDLKIHKPGELAAATPLSVAQDAALDLAILGIKAGRAIADVVKIAVQRFRAKFPDATDEDVARLTKAIHEAAGTPPEPPAGKKSSPEKLMEKAGAKFREIKDNASLKDAISAQRDAVDNAAGLTASEVKTEISDALSRKESDPKLAKTADNALRFFIEANDGDAAKLKEMRDKVANSTKVNPKWQKEALAAIDYAAANGDKLKDAAQRYRRITGNQLDYEKMLGLPTVEAKNYVPRYQDVDEAGFLEPKGGSGSGASNRKVRTHETMADSLAAGVDPKSLSAVDSLTNRVRSGNVDAGLKAWHQAFFDMKAPDGQPVAVKPEKVTRADGTSYYQAPKGYEMKLAKGEPTAIKKEFSRAYDALTEPNWFSKNPAGLAAQELNGLAKSAMLAADTFHLGRLALRSSMLNLSNGKVGPRFQEGLLVANHSPAEIERMGASGEIPKEDVKRLVENKNILYNLVENGYNVGRISDALHQELVQKIPVLSGINKFIFDRFQRGAMTDAGVMEFRRMKEANPKMDDATVARNVAKELNTLFGNLGRQGLFKSATAQAMARFAMLAPQWNEGLIRSEAGGVAQTAKYAKDAFAGKSPTMGIRGRNFLTTAASLFVASQLMNLASRGKPTWENPEESADAKMSGWIPDAIGKSSGFFFNPAGLTAETSHILMKNFERSGNVRDATKSYLRGRESALARMVDTYFTGEDPLGRQIPKDQIWGAIAKAGAPVPISGGSVLRAGKALAAKASGEPVNTEKFPGEFQKQAMQSFGVRTDAAPSPEQRISSLAHDFNTAHGKEDTSPREVSDFAELNAALRRSNGGDVKDAISGLLEKRSAEDLEKYYRQWQNRTFTGSNKNEARFLQTLNTEQRQQYAKARAERRQIGEAALKAIRQIPAGKRAGPFAPAP